MDSAFHRILIALSLALLSLIGFAGSTTAAPGDLDPTFGTGGVVTTHVVPASLSCSCHNRARALAIQADGKIVAVGMTTNVSETGIFHGDFAVVRYNQDGSLDQSFGSGGIVITDVGDLTEDAGTAAAIQSDGKILVAGNTGLSNGASVFALIRYNLDGSLDTNFGTDGKVIETFGSFSSRLNALVIQTDGKFVIAGESQSQDGRNDFGLARFNTEGSLDASFGNNGKVITDILAESFDIAYSLAIQSDGKIVAAGSTFFVQNAPYGDFAVVRYNSDGSIDLTFGTSGKVITDFNGSMDHGLAVTIQADGKIVVAGAAFTLSNRQDLALARYNNDGTLDLNFGIGGKVTANLLPAPSNNVAEAVAVQANGKIVIAGTVSSGAHMFAVGRFNSDGTLDTIFANGGLLTTPIGANDFAHAISIQADGKLVVAGEAHIGSCGVFCGNSQFALARYKDRDASFLSFPLRGTSPGVDQGLDPYKALVNSVFDHSMKCLTSSDPSCSGNDQYRIYGCDDAVQAYTAELGNMHPSGLHPRGFRSGCREGYAQGETHSPFYVNGNYKVGGDTGHLSYDGHPGIDYRAADGTELYAVASGTIRYPQNIVGLASNTAYGTYHALELVPDAFPDYKIYYLHLSTHPSTGVTVQKNDPTPGCSPVVTLPLPESPGGYHVNAGCLIALSGHAGPRGTPAHLHFEVQKIVPIDQVSEGARASLACIDDATKACVPVDPYGWDGEGIDPYIALTGVSNSRLWAHTPVVNSISTSSAAVSAGVFNLTVTGNGFDDGVRDRIVRKTDFVAMRPGAVVSRSSTQLVVQQNLPAGTYFVQVKNGDGRLSNWKKLVVE